jgi:cell pole-organizing protein PopZ
MGDISAEPSMEDILSSIKRIIAEEGDAAIAARGARRAPPPRPAPMSSPRADVDDFDRDEILELGDSVRAPAPEPLVDTPRVQTLRVERVAPVVPAPVVPAPVEAVAPRIETPVVSTDSIISAHATQATRGPLEALSRMVVKPDVSGADTLENLVREMLRPMLRDWLDAKLPGLVEQMVAKEIARITGQQ